MQSNNTTGINPAQQHINLNTYQAHAVRELFDNAHLTPQLFLKACPRSAGGKVTHLNLVNAAGDMWLPGIARELLHLDRFSAVQQIHGGWVVRDLRRLLWPLVK